MQRVLETKSHHRHIESRLINLGNHEISFLSRCVCFCRKSRLHGVWLFRFSLSTQTTFFKRTTEIDGNERSNLKFVDLIGFWFHLFIYRARIWWRFWWRRKSAQTFKLNCHSHGLLQSKQILTKTNCCWRRFFAVSYHWKLIKTYYTRWCTRLQHQGVSVHKSHIVTLVKALKTKVFLLNITSYPCMFYEADSATAA